MKAFEWWRILERVGIVLFLAVAALLFAAGVASSPRDLPATPDPTIRAYAFAMPGQGWAPLTVYFSAYGSNTTGRPLVRYEWDLDGDGDFETDASAAGGYVQHTFIWAADYSISLRVTDAQGRFAVAGTTVSVRHPAGSSVDYWSLFDDRRVQRIDLSVTRANSERLWADPHAKTEVEASAVIFGERVDRLGLRMKGNASLDASGAKKSWMLDFNAFDDRREFHSLTALVLNNNFGDPSLLREKLAYDMMHLAGVQAGFASFVEVWFDVSDDPAPPEYLGVYLMIERPDRAFLENRFGRRNDGGNLYKADAYFEEGAADLAYYGDAIEDYPMPRGRVAYRKMTNEEEGDYADIIDLCYAIDGQAYASPGEFSAAVEEVLDVDSYLRYMAVIFVNLNLDTYPYTGNNFYLYHDPGTDRFVWIAWDLNNSWANFGGAYDFPLYGEAHGPGPLARAPLFIRVFEVERYRRAYSAYVDLLLRQWFNDGAFRPRARAWHDLLAPYVRQGAGDPFFFGSSPSYDIGTFDAGWERLADLTRARHDYLQDALLDNVP